ncbi:HDIG domain-containing protein [Candidatus Poribacteria bacterium]|nr:HDIG domain-containing protein [Candidatus Poribacteria bacterium]
MRIIPLARKVREIRRGRDEQETPVHHPGRWVALFVLFLLTVLVTSPAVWVRPIPTRAGEELTAPVKAAVSFSFVSPHADQEWRERRDREHDRVYIYDSRVQLDGAARLDKILAAAGGIDTREGNPALWRDSLAEADNQLKNWTPEGIERLVRFADDERMTEAAHVVLQELYRDYVITPDKARYLGHRQRSVARVRSVARPPAEGMGSFEAGRLLSYPDQSRATAEQRLRALVRGFAGAEASQGEVGMELLDLVVRPNLVFSEDETLKSFETFEQRVSKQELTQQFTEGDQLLAGVSLPHPLTEDEAALLRAYDRARSRVNLYKFGAHVVFVLMAFLIVSFFVMKFSREIRFTTDSVLLLSLPVLLALTLGRIFLLLAGPSFPNAGFAFPAGVIGILGVLLLDVRLALLIVTWGCLLFGLEADLDYQFVIVGLFGGYTGVAALYTFRERREVLYAGMLIGVANATTILVIKFIGDSTADVWASAIIGAMSGIMCALISFAVLPVFEVMFHITTDMRLLELTGLQHPLLRELEEKAPGTWQHTLNVTKLAESAASAIGVNYLLVRAGCYFHDIGKMSKPEYFTENQLTPEDKRRHAELKPQMSTLIIRNHVKEGLELAEEHRLPRVVRNFIPEHHGTSLIAFFYHKALTASEKGESKEPVREEDYRYPGPKPQTIESAIAMLADTVEATATAKLSGRSVREDDIQMLVRTAILDKFNDGQFDNCNLTMRDLNIIRESFVKTLRSRFHSRIDYPALKKEQAARREGKDAKDSKVA